MRTHFVTAEKYNQAVERGVGAVLMLRPICGAKATSRGQLELRTDWEHVDCTRCLGRKPAEASA